MTLLKATRLRLGDVLIMIDVIGRAPCRIYKILVGVESGVPSHLQSANCYSDLGNLVWLYTTYLHVLQTSILAFGWPQYILTSGLLAMLLYIAMTVCQTRSSGQVDRCWHTDDIRR